MTKRFTCKVVDNGLFRIERITDNEKGDIFSDCKTVTELLNRFCEENDKLKDIIIRYAKHELQLIDLLTHLEYETHINSYGEIVLTEEKQLLRRYKNE